MEERPYKKFIDFLEALSRGEEITIDNRTYALGFDSKNQPRLSHKVKSFNSETEESYQYIEGLDLHEINEFLIYIMNNFLKNDIDIERFRSI